MIGLTGKLLSKALGQKRLEGINSTTLGFCYFLFLILLLFITIGATVGFYSLLSWPPEKGRHGVNYQNIYAEQPQRPAVGVICADENFASVCEKSDASHPTKYEEKSNDFRKNLRDLNAQEGMWRAALALVLLTLAQVFVGIFTVYFLIKTFKTQRSELSAANRTAIAAEKAERAHLFVTFNSLLDEDKRFKIVAKIKNFGKSPAKKVFLWVVEATETARKKGEVGISAGLRPKPFFFEAIGPSDSRELELDFGWAELDNFIGEPKNNFIFSYRIEYEDLVVDKVSPMVDCYVLMAIPSHSVASGISGTTTSDDKPSSVTLSLTQVGVGPSVGMIPADEITAKKYEITDEMAKRTI